MWMRIMRNMHGGMRNERETAENYFEKKKTTVKNCIEICAALVNGQRTTWIWCHSNKLWFNIIWPGEAINIETVVDVKQPLPIFYHLLMYIRVELCCVCFAVPNVFLADRWKVNHIKWQTWKMKNIPAYRHRQFPRPHWISATLIYV